LHKEVLLTALSRPCAAILWTDGKVELLNCAGSENLFPPGSLSDDFAPVFARRQDSFFRVLSRSGRAMKNIMAALKAVLPNADFAIRRLR
jgi:hypothetical protein